jgi:L-lactate dehydrogenase complex protein LldG
VNDSRETILARFRAKHQTVPPPRVASNPPLPEVGRNPVAAFTERARRLSSHVIGPLAPAAACTAVAGYLHEHTLPMRAVCWPDVARLDWRSAGVETEVRAARGSDLVGINSAFCAIAETGTLMLLSGRDTPAAVSLLPETHVALLPVGRIVARMEDAWTLLRREHGSLPRAVNFVSGPSRTADIEQTVTLGAHGPYRVLIVLTE